MKVPGRGGAWRAVAVAWAGVASLAHLQFSIWLVAKRPTPFGVFSLSQLVPWVALVAGLWLLGRATRQCRVAGLRSRRTAAWLCWGLAVVAVDRTLTYSLNELAHYPQYALLAWLLARGLDPDRRRWVAGRVLVLATLLGLFDEAVQYVWIAAEYGDYFDVNDGVVNLLGAVLGLLLYYPPEAGRREPPGRPLGSAVAVAVVALALGAGLASGRLQMAPPGEVPPGGVRVGEDGVARLYLQREPGAYGGERRGFRRPTYRVLTPREGLGMALLGLTLFGRLLAPALDPRGRTKGKDREEWT
ncbi:MAG: VanZ family protein [Rhodocyclaceae bacterium]|nr:VanZ family protein [Rhodocyclaceae bacterium]